MAHTFSGSNAGCRAGLTTLLILLFTTTWASAQPPDHALKQRLAQAADQGHPRLFFDSAQREALHQRIKNHPRLRRAYRRMTQRTERLFGQPPVQRRLEGKRMLGVSRRCLHRVTRLAFLYRITGQKRYAERARKEMLAAAQFKNWNPSHFLDVAEITAALAIGYDWLHGALDPEARRTIRQAIITKGLQASLDGGWWVTTTNNWNQVCHGGLTLGALAVAEHNPQLARRIIRRALDNIDRAMDVYGPRGGYPEGPSYWNYGSSYNVLLIDALESTLGTSFGLTQRQGFMRSAGYYLHTQGPTGRYFNYSDAGPDARLAPAVFWFASRRDRPSLLWFEAQRLKQYAAGERSAGRLLPFLFIWSPPLKEVPAPDQNHRRVEGKTPVGLHRSAWNEQALFAGLKAGSPSTNHAHMDIGSFVMSAAGVRWAIDLGAQNYHSLESAGIDLWNMSQDSERWRVFRLNNYSHNTLVVNDALQRVESHAPIERFSRGTKDNGWPQTTIDMTPAYQGQLASARRRVALVRDKAVLIEDHITAPPKNPATVRWAMATRAEIETVSPTQARLHQAGKTLRLIVLQGGVLGTYPTDPPPAEHDAPNPGTRLVGFTIKREPGQNQTLRVILTMQGTGPENADPAAWRKWMK